MTHSIKVAFVLTLIIFCLSSESFGDVLTSDTVWKGEITLDDDILVPAGVTLTILPGTVVNIQLSDRTRTDPEYLSSMTEITVRGKLDVKADGHSRVIFRVKDTDQLSLWAGLIIDGGSVSLRSVIIRNAETGIQVLNGSLSIKDSTIEHNRYGLISYDGAVVKVTGSGFHQNSYGIFEFPGSSITYKSVSVTGNLKKDVYLYGKGGKNAADNALREVGFQSLFTRENSSCPAEYGDMMTDYTQPEQGQAKRYGNDVLLADTVWRGRIEIDGLIRVPQGVRLIIMPGTVIGFKFRDTNGDGIGENGILMQGVLIAKGTSENPIIFRSAEPIRRMGDWDAINILNSDGTRNLIEFCQIEDAYKGLHFHFANVIINGSVLKNNYRAIQFQESSVELRDSSIFNNKSGIKARDSRITFLRNRIFDNINGASFFRTNLTAHDNFIMGNLGEGLRIREGVNSVSDNLFDCNRFGLMIKNTYFGKFNRNIISNNFETGISLKESDNIELEDSYIQGNAFNGINILSTGAVIRGNQIYDNGERGLGIQSFTGVITGNSMTGNGLYAIDNQGPSDIEAPGNWWGEGSPDTMIFDRSDDEERGKVNISPVSDEPFFYEWPIKTIDSGIVWRDRILLKDSVTVTEDGELQISPGTEVRISKGKGIKVSGGRLIVEGTSGKNITFRSVPDSAEARWDEILLEHADGSIFSYCDIQGAEWAIHSHFTSLPIDNCIIKNNYGGIRFRSGPLKINNSVITGNSIGIRSFWGIAAIVENDITDNETGIFVREKGGGLTIRNNNINSNSRYNIKVGDFNIEDIDAGENWWGTLRPEDTIFDGRSEPGVGKVLFDPVLTGPFRK